MSAKHEIAKRGKSFYLVSNGAVVGGPFRYRTDATRAQVALEKAAHRVANPEYYAGK